LPVELRRSPLRLLAGVAVIAAVALEIQSLGHALQGQARQRERLLEKLEGHLDSLPAQIAERLRDEEPPWSEALASAARATSALEAELFDAQGRLVAAYPARTQVVHWPKPAEMERLQAHGRLLVGPLGVGEPRMLVYTAIPGQGQTVLLRLGFPGWELLEDMEARRQYLVGHAVTLVVLLLAGVMAVFPPGERVEAVSPRVLEAYHAALERLRDHGQAEVRRHQTERQRLEEEKHDREAMVRAGELTAGMVHEVRNGLNTILGYARLVEQAGGPPGASDAAARIRDECAHLVALVRRFMEFIKRDAVEAAPVSIARMLARVASRESAEAGGARVAVRDGADQRVLADEDLLERAFENLMRNARQAAGPHGHVWVDWRVDGDALVVTVADDGPGMPAELRANVRPFFTTKAGGLGLGLATAHKIVRLHGGGLVLGERSPRGLVATVRLPLADVARPLPIVATGGAPDAEAGGQTAHKS
jgi:signal transduction histidine kinase